MTKTGAEYYAIIKTKLDVAKSQIRTLESLYDELDLLCAQLLQLNILQLENRISKEDAYKKLEYFVSEHLRLNGEIMELKNKTEQLQK